MFCSVVLLIALACFAMASAPTAAAGAKPASVLFRFLLLTIPRRTTAVESACSRRQRGQHPCLWFLRETDAAA